MCIQIITEWIKFFNTSFLNTFKSFKVLKYNLDIFLYTL